MTNQVAQLHFDKLYNLLLTEIILDIMVELGNMKTTTVDTKNNNRKSTCVVIVKRIMKLNNK